MRLWKSWILAKKDMKIIRRKKSFIVGLIILPIFMGIGLPSLLDYLIIKKGIQSAVLTDLLGAFGFFFVLISVFLPLYLSSYSLVGEKIEKSLEPLLSTPTSDEEILVGKYIGVLIPAVLAIYFGAAIFMVLANIFTLGPLGYFFFPNLSFGIILLIAVPLASLYAISFSVFVSAKVNNTQAAYQLGVLSVIPFIVIYVMGELGMVSLISNMNILIISAILLIMTIVTFLISRATFKREEILTNWK